MISFFKKILWFFPCFGNILYKKKLEILRNSRYFDEKYYYFLRPDVFVLKKDAALHYLLYDWEEKVNPSEYFCTEEYLTAYPDVNFNPLLHYECFGKNENRSIGIKPLLTEIINKQNETITNLENKLTTIQNSISSLEEKFIFNKQQYTSIQEEQENQLTTIQNTVSFIQENLNFARRQTAEIQLAVQDEQKLRQNKSNEINDLKKHIDSTTDSLQTKLTEQEKYFENKLSCFLQELETSKEAGKKQFETIEKLKYDFESKLIKAKTEQELNFLNYQKQEHEKTLKVQRDLFEIEKQIFKLNENNFYTDILKK